LSEIKHEQVPTDIRMLLKDLVQALREINQRSSVPHKPGLIGLLLLLLSLHKPDRVQDIVKGVTIRHSKVLTWEHHGMLLAENFGNGFKQLPLGKWLSERFSSAEPFR